MGVRTYEAQPPASRPRSRGVGAGATLVVFVFSLVLLLANARPIGEAEPGGAAGWLRGAAFALAGSVFELDAAGRAIVGKLVAAVLAALAGAALFAAVARRHGTSEGRWAAFALVLGTTLAAAAQAFSGEVAATCAVAVAVWLLTRADAEEDGRLAARAGLPLALAVAFQISALPLALVLAVGALLRWRCSALTLPLWAAPGIALAAVEIVRDEAARAAAAPGPGVLALVASPAKGALVFAPVAFVGLVGLVRALATRRARFWDAPPPSRALPLACGAGFMAHLAALTVLGGWADGVFWGPRLVAPAWPVVLLFLPEGLAALKLLGTVLVLVSMGIQGLGLLAYDGRWDRLHRARDGTLGAATWNVSFSPIPFQWREGVLRPSLLGVEGRRLLVREHVIAPGALTASFVSFGAGRLRPTGADPTMERIRLESGARVVGDRLELRSQGDGIAFRVREGSQVRRLELRVVGSGSGTIGLGESGFSREIRWRKRRVSGVFRLRFPYRFAEAAGPDLIVALRAGGPVRLESLALVPPAEPEDVIRLP